MCMENWTLGSKIVRLQTPFSAAGSTEERHTETHSRSISNVIGMFTGGNNQIIKGWDFRFERYFHA